MIELFMMQEKLKNEYLILNLKIMKTIIGFLAAIAVYLFLWFVETVFLVTVNGFIYVIFMVVGSALATIVYLNFATRERKASVFTKRY
jgi:hypothetical protein